MASSSTIILITGANAGLGFETVKSLYQSSHPYTILLGGRSLDKVNTAISELQKAYPNSKSTASAVQVDIEDDKSIEQAFEQVSKQYGHLDVLINNAGAQFDQQIAAGKLGMREAWNKSWDVNTSGTYVLTYTFVPLLLKSSNPRLLFITSGTSTLGESENLKVAVNKPPEAGWPKPLLGIPAYRAAKTGMNMMMREWYRLLKGDGVKIWCISPGMLATGLGFGDKEKLKAMGAEDPVLGANFVRDVVEGARDDDVGKVIRRADVQAW